MACRILTRLAIAVPVALGCLAGGHPATVSAQQSTFKSGVDMVPLTVTVTDVKGRPITGLTGGDFKVLEDGVEQPLAFFAAAEVPVDVALVIDTSTSMRLNLPIVQKAACGLLRTLHAADRGAVVEIKDAVRVPQPLTSDMGQLEASVHALRASGGTALYDGLYVMLKEFDRARRATQDVRRQVLILLSDGLDNTSHLPADQVMELARRVGVNIYVIALQGEAVPVRRAERDDYVLHAEYEMRTVAREAGGRAFFPRSAGELPAIYETIAQELASQYQLGYVPMKPGGDGNFRRVAVRLLTNGLARTRSGYYANGTPGAR
jgi:Ca-activated chloride channel family protein